MMLQQRSVEIPSAVLVTNDNDRLRCHAKVAVAANLVDQFSQQANRHMRQGGPFGAEILGRLVELRWKHISRANRDRPNADDVASLAKSRAQQFQFVRRGINRQRAIKSIVPRESLVLRVWIGIAELDDCRPAVGGLSDRGQRRMDAALQLPQPESRLVKSFRI